MKRTCDGCRALQMMQGGINKCILGYKFDDKFKPLEECPKPKNYADLIYLQGRTTRNKIE